MTFANDFTRDVATHAMQMIRNDGVNRHLRFQRPGTMCMHFDVLTWPGYLCYTGDMGTYVFRRLHDMFQFFRRSENREPYRIDLRYWAEKIEAQARDGVMEYSADAFRASVERRFAEYTEAMEESERAGLRENMLSSVLAYADDGQHDAVRAALDFTHDVGRRQQQVFPDFWERDVTVYTHRFLWCCHALEWAISTCDAQTAGAPAVAA